MFACGDQLLIKGVWQRIQDEMVRRGGAIPAHELIHSNKYYPFDRSRCEKDLQLTIFDPECFKLAADEILTSHPNIQPHPVYARGRADYEWKPGYRRLCGKQGGTRRDPGKACDRRNGDVVPFARSRRRMRVNVRQRAAPSGADPRPFSEPAGSVRSRRPTGLT